MNKNAVIIGGGLGGLFTGAILSKEGISVTIVEKNATLGGGLQSFKRFGEIFDTGMHVIAGMQEGGNVKRICDYLGITDKIHVSNVDPDEIDHIYFAEDKQHYKIAQGREEFIQSLADKFPDQKENLTTYVDAMFKLVGELDLFYLRPSSDMIAIHSEDFMIAANDFIAKYISDEHLRSVVAYMNPLYSGKGNTTPTYIHAIVSVLYIMGPSRFAGGSQLFADTLGEFIQQNGGTIILNDGIEKVYTQEKNITHVVTRKGLQLKADYYICAIHPSSFIKMLDDPKALPKAYRNRLDEIPNTYSAFTLNIKLKPGTFPYLNYTGYYISKYDEVWNFGQEGNTWPLGFLYMTPPELEQGPYSTKMIITAPMNWEVVAPWTDTTVGKRGEDYERWKEECSEMLISRLEEIYPDIRDHIEALNAASPLTIRDYYNVKEGAMCGYQKDCKNMTLSHLPIATKIRNLFLTGQNIHLHGFVGVPLTAINTSEAILGRNYVLNKINNVCDTDEHNR